MHWYISEQVFILLKKYGLMGFCIASITANLVKVDYPLYNRYNIFFLKKMEDDCDDLFSKYKILLSLFLT